MKKSTKQVTGSRSHLRSKNKNNLKRRRDNKQDLDKTGNGNLKVKVLRRGLVIPDQYSQTFIYSEQQRNIFNTAATTGSETWAFTDLNAFRTGVSPTVINGLTSAAGAVNSDANRMRRCRVNKVHFIARVQSREAVNPQTVILHPSQTLPAVSTAAEVQWLMEQQSNCVRTVGPIGSGNAYQELRMSYNPEKFFGEQYHEQDEYSSAISIGAITSPTTPVYMGLSFHNTNINTVTTGGLVLTLTVKIDVLFYQPDRDEDPSTFKSLDQEIEDLEKRILLMRTRSRKLDREKSK